MQRSVVIDTNIYTAFTAGDMAVVDLISGASTILVPVVVVGELYHGFFNGSKAQQNISNFKSFLSSSRVDILQFTDRTPLVYGEIITELRRSGKPMQTNDIWIAALCKENNLPLTTKDQGFQNIMGLEIVELS